MLTPSTIHANLTLILLQLRPISVLTTWMNSFEKAADYYTKHTNMLKTDENDHQR